VNSYILCTSPRSGSTLLCKLLSATGVAGHPGSHFHKPSITAWMDSFRLPRMSGETEADTLNRVFAAALQKGRGETGVFGLRLQRHSFDFFTQKLSVLCPDGATDLERLRVAFGEVRFVYLTRQDKVGQAVSYVKAEQSGLWHKAPDGTELERLSDPQELQYDFETLKTTFDRFEGYDRDWQAWFSEQKIEPVGLTYETLSADPQAALRHVLVGLDLDIKSAEGVEPGVSKLADDVSADWAARFRRHLTAVNAAKV